MACGFSLALGGRDRGGRSKYLNKKEGAGEIGRDRIKTQLKIIVNGPLHQDNEMLKDEIFRLIGAQSAA